MILDLFSGCGGWSEGLRALGLHDVGLELDCDCCLTRRAAGHLTVRADVAAYPPEAFAGRCEGLIASPPCQAFSAAGKGSGRRDIKRLHTAVELCRAGWTDAALAGPWGDPRTPLILQPLRWAWTVRPRWIACEQVPPALPIWRHMADVLRSWGYSATAVKLLASDYGVPQTRLRAFLLASLDGPVRVPEPTHAKHPRTGLFGETLPWVSMATALGWGYDDDPCTTVRGMGGGGGGGGLNPITGGAGAREKRLRAQESGEWVVRTGTNSMKHNRDVGDMVPYERSIDQPAPTVDAKVGGAWRLQVGSQANATTRPAPAPALVFAHDAAGVRWVYERPATSIVGTWCPDIVAPPGHREYTGVSRQDVEGAVRITLAEAAVLQGMRWDYPFHGTKSSTFSQVGNVVPPAVARAVVAALRGEG